MSSKNIMTFKNILFAGLTAVGLLSALPAIAQETQPAAAAAGEAAQPERRPEDNWLKVCGPTEDGTQKACIMRQIISVNGQFIGSFVLRDDPGQENRLFVVAAVPLGVLLPFGLSWQIDNGKPFRLPYVICDPQSCASQTVINEAFVNLLKKGSKLKLTAKNRQNKDLVVEVDLAGFTAVYEGDDAMTFEDLRDEQTGASALEQVLQDRAEQIRREKDDTPAQ